jgi:3-dehydroquinate dehydratase
MDANLGNSTSAKDVEFEAYKKLFYALIDIPSKTDSIKSKHDYVKARILECVQRLERSGIDYRIRD